jgi:hypothetical protein
MDEEYLIAAIRDVHSIPCALAWSSEPRRGRTALNQAMTDDIGRLVAAERLRRDPS